MHAQTHAIEQDQEVLAPVNHFSHSEHLVTPSAQAGLRAPNNDTLYFRGWFDLSEEPIVLHTPDTQGRYYMLAVTNFFAEVQAFKSPHHGHARAVSTRSSGLVGMAHCPKSSRR